MFKSLRDEQSKAESQVSNQVDSFRLRLKNSSKSANQTKKEILNLKQQNNQTFEGSKISNSHEKGKDNSSSQSKPALSSNISKYRSAKSQGRTVTNSHQSYGSPNIFDRVKNISESQQFSIKKKKEKKILYLANSSSEVGSVKSPSPKIQSEESNQASQIDDFAIQDQSNCIESSSSQSVFSDQLIEKEGFKNSDKTKDQNNQNTEKSGSDDEIIKNQDSDISEEHQGEIRGSEDPTKIVFRRMKKFYKDNYTSHKIAGSTDFLNKKIWNVIYSSSYDLVYIFSATLSQIKGEELVDFSEKKLKVSKKLGEAVEREVIVHIINEQSGEQPIPFNQNPLFPTQESSRQKQDQTQESRAKVNQQINREKKALQIYQNCEVYLELTLQIWNVEDRVILDKDHQVRPIKEFEILKKTMRLDEKMNIFEQMNFVRNSLGDYAQVIQY